MHFRFLTLAALLLVFTACGQTAPEFGDIANQPHEHTTAEAHGHDTPTTTSLQPALATSEIVVGPNRIALGLLENNVPITDAADTSVTVRFYRLEGDQATLVGEEQARYYDEGLGPRGTYIVHPTFDTAGKWGLELQVQRPDQEPSSHRLSIDVAEKGSAVRIGDMAPRTKTPTATEVTDLRTITSAAEPDARLYQQSVEQAVASGKPSMILFATPGFCQTAVCGPGVDVVRRLADTFGDKVNAVHVEVYQYPFDPLKLVPAMGEWGLRTEPWLFLVDREGRVQARFEGGITIPELEPEVAKLLQ